MLHTPENSEALPSEIQKFHIVRPSTSAFLMVASSWWPGSLAARLAAAEAAAAAAVRRDISWGEGTGCGAKQPVG